MKQDKRTLVAVVLIAVASTYIGIHNLQWFTRHIACNLVSIFVKRDVCKS